MFFIFNLLNILLNFYLFLSNTHNISMLIDIRIYVNIFDYFDSYNFSGYLLFIFIYDE